MRQIKLYHHNFFKNALAAGGADVNVIEFRNIEGGKRRKLLSITNHLTAVDNTTGLQQAVVNNMPAVGLYVSGYIRIQELINGLPVDLKFRPETITPAAGVGNGWGSGIRLFLNQKTYFNDLTFIEGIRVTMDVNNNLPVNPIYYNFDIWAEIEIQ